MSYTTVLRFAKLAEKTPFVPHDRYDPDRWTGSIGLLWSIPEAYPVFIGSGLLAFEEVRITSSIPLIEPPPRSPRLGNVSRAPAEATRNMEIVMEFVRQGRLPVLPGSSLKGAVRQAYELLTPSCDPSERACMVGPKVLKPGPRQLCPACSLFGAAGYGGRAAFGEGTAESTEFRFTTKEVPEAWNDKKFEAPENTYRVHKLRKDTDRDNEERKEKEKARAVWGYFHSKIFLTNVTKDEIGILLLALGLGCQESPGFRLGGKKYHGLGGADVSVEIAEQYRPMTALTWETDPQQWAADLRNRAFQDTGRTEAWNRWQTALRSKEQDKSRRKHEE